MKVLHLSRSDMLGGAAMSAFRLHQALKESSIDSWMFVEDKVSSDYRILVYQPSKAISTRIKRRLQRIKMRKELEAYFATRPPNLEVFSHDQSPYGSSVPSQFPIVDILNLHWINSFVDVGLLVSTIGRSMPMVWTLHDMNPFTGGCHFDMGCGKYTASCGRCPQLGSRESSDLSSEVFQRKRGAYSELGNHQLQVVAPSRWLAAEAGKSTLLQRFEISVIPYSVDSNVFQPRDGLGLRKKHSIPEASKVVLFAADMMSNRRKGLDLFVTALAQLQNPENVILVTVGGGETNVSDLFRSVHLGKIDSETAMSDVFSMADVFVAPSREDNLPNTVLEAMACGKPVVAFDIGGMPDMIKHGETGLLAIPEDATSLAGAIEKLLDSAELRQTLGCRAREVAITEFAPGVQAARYTQVYESLLQCGLGD